MRSLLVDCTSLGVFLINEGCKFEVAEVNTLAVIRHETPTSSLQPLLLLLLLLLLHLEEDQLLLIIICESL